MAFYMDLDWRRLEEMLEAVNDAGCSGVDGFLTNLSDDVEVQLSRRLYDCGRLMWYFTVKAAGLRETRKFEEAPSFQEAVELVEWLTGCMVAKSVTES